MYLEQNSLAERQARPRSKAWWQQGRWWLVLMLATIAALPWAAKYRNQLLTTLPYLTLLACPLMHLFMHRGHRGHGGNNPQGGPYNEN